MKKVTVTALVPEKKDAEGNITQAALGPASVEVDYGDTASESIKMFGEEPMNSNAFSNWKVTLQSGIRSGLKKGENPAAIQARLGSAKMGVASTGAKIDAEAAYKAKFMSATPDAQKKMIEDLRKAAQK